MSMTDQVASAAGARAGSPVLVIDALDYGRAVVLQGAAVPWGPLEHVRFLGQLAALLSPDRTLIDAGALVADAVAGRPELVEAMGARSRTGYALRTLLADESIGGTVFEVLRIAAGSGARPLVLQVPSPEVWLRATAEIAGADAEVDADDAENASVYVADWLRRFAESGVDTVVLDARAAPRTERLGDYGPLTGLADHYRWGLVLRGREDAEARTGTAGVLARGYWRGEDVPVPEVGLLLATIPADAEPERVLALRSALGGGR